MSRPQQAAHVQCNRLNSNFNRFATKACLSMTLAALASRRFCMAIQASQNEQQTYSSNTTQFEALW